MLLTNKRTWSMFNFSISSIKRRRIYVLVSYSVAIVACGYLAFLDYDTSPRFIYGAVFVLICPAFFSSGDLVKSLRESADLSRTESLERNEVHFIAYGIIRRILLVASIGYGVLCLLPRVDQVKIHNMTVGCFWLLAYIIVTLPRDLVLWRTERIEEEPG